MKALITTCFVLLVCLSLNAQTIDVNSTTGIWTSASPAANASGVGTSLIYWGGTSPPGGDGSGYRFAGAQPPEAVAIGPGTPFLLGTFTHYNFPIPAGTSITAATLDVTMGMTIPSDGAGGVSNVTKTFTYNWDHWETSNSSNPCANGGVNGVGVNVNGCADRATILNPTPNQNFTIGNTEYTLFMGFSNDGGNTIVSQFWTMENGANRASLYGYFTTQVVPEPGFYGLLGLGLAGLYTAVRRRRRVV